jgi:HK97 family phage prohead protease
MIKVELRAGNIVEISGYVNAVERDSRVLPASMSGGRINTPFVERVKAGAFRRAIEKSDDTEIKLNHTKHLGSRKENNLTLYEDNVGLYAKATITDKELADAAAQRKLTGWSFAFTNPVDSVETIGDNMSRRELKEFDLAEVSILTVTPAYIGTSVVEARSEDCKYTESRSFEDEAEITSEHKEDNSEDKKVTAQRNLLKMKTELLKLKGKEYEYES